MKQHPPKRHRYVPIIRFTVAAVLLFFFAVPIGILLYGGSSGVLGLLLLGSLIVIQLPVFILLKRIGKLPPTDRTTN